MSYPQGEPKFLGEKEMFIGAYNAPTPTDENYKNIAECGITHLFLNTMVGYEKNDVGYYKTPFELAEKYGFKIVVHSNCGGYGNVIQNKEHYKKQKTFAGLLAIDEPPETRFGMLKFDYEYYKKDFPDSPYYINLLPIYSEPYQLGWVDYTEHLRSYKETLLKNYDPRFRVLMCDTYPLKDGPSILEKWLLNIEMLRQIATETGAELHFYLQDQGFWGSWRQPTTLEELTFQLYTYLAFGAKGISHYPYLTPSSEKPDQKGIVCEDESKSFMFPLAKSLNELVKKIDGVILDFEWKAVVRASANKDEYKGFDLCSDFKSSCGILHGASSDTDAIIGCFTNKDGYQGFMVVNFSEPLGGTKNKVTLMLDGVNRAVVFIDGAPSEKTIDDGKLVLELNKGEGVFVVPYNE